MKQTANINDLPNTEYGKLRVPWPAISADRASRTSRVFAPTPVQSASNHQPNKRKSPGSEKEKWLKTSRPDTPSSMLQLAPIKLSRKHPPLEGVILP